VASGLATASGTLSLSGTTSIGSGAILQTASNGTVVLGGTVANSGTLFASGPGSLVNIASGAVVNGGGVAEVGNGIVDIQANGDNQNVSFLKGGSGGLELADTAGNPSAFGGRVVGFGQNTKQFIDLTTVASGGGVSLSYSSNTSTSGVLTVLSGGTVVASINFSGSYTTSSFHLTSGTGGTVEIFDPPVEPQKNTGATTNSAHHPLLPDPFMAGSPSSNDDLAGMHWPNAPDTVAGALTWGENGSDARDTALAGFATQHDTGGSIREWGIDSAASSIPPPDPTSLKYEPKDQTVSMFSWDHGSQSQVSTQLSEALESFAPVASENLLFSPPGSIDQPMNRANDMAKLTKFLAGWDQGRSQAASTLFSTTTDSRNSFAQDDRTSHPFAAASGRP
jgi:hypothetical protein